VVEVQSGHLVLFCVLSLVTTGSSQWVLTTLALTALEQGCDLNVTEVIILEISSNLTQFVRYIAVDDDQILNVEYPSALVEFSNETYTPEVSGEMSSDGTLYIITINLDPPAEPTQDVTFTINYLAIDGIREVTDTTLPNGDDVNKQNNAVILWDIMSTEGWDGTLDNLVYVSFNFIFSSPKSVAGDIQVYPTKGSKVSSTHASYSTQEPPAISQGVQTAFYFPGSTSCKSEDGLWDLGSSVITTVEAIAAWIIAVVVIGFILVCVVPIVLIVLCCTGVLGGIASREKQAFG